MAKYSFMLGEYTEDDQVYHFGLPGKMLLYHFKR